MREREKERVGVKGGEERERKEEVRGWRSRGRRIGGGRNRKTKTN